MRLTRVSQRRGYSGILFDGSTSAPLRQERKVEIPITHTMQNSGIAVASAVLSGDYRRQARCAEDSARYSIQISKSTLAFQPPSVRSTEKS